MNSNVIEFTVDTALTEVEKLNCFIDGLLELSNKINTNSYQIKNIQEQLRRQEINSNFYTVAEVAEALHCQTKKAFEELRARNVEIIEAGKTYVVQKDNFLNAFRQV